MALVDTSFIIDLLDDDPDAVGKLDELIEIGESLWVPAIALHELYYGAYLHDEPEEEVARIRELEEALLPIVFSSQAAQLAGRIEANMEAEGQRPGRADVQIAASAIEKGQALVSGDGRFAEIEGLRVESY